MAKTCDFCERGPRAGTSRSHSHIATKKRVFINLQTKTIGGARTRICTRCIKTRNKTA